MQGLFKHIIVLFIFCLIGCDQTKSKTLKEFEILSVEAPLTSNVAQPINITIESKGGSPLLLISHSLGSTVVQPIKIDQSKTQYRVPAHITKMSGILDWKILNSKDGNSGRITINPENEANTIEVYIGPTNLMAGRSKSAMTTALLYDQYDNLVSTYPTSLYTTSPNGSITRDQRKTDNGLIYQMHDAPIQTGNLTVAVYTSSATTLEYKYRVNANNPTNFRIQEHRQHRFSDGTSLCQFETDRLRDRYGNIVEDGTIVHFTVINNRVTSQCQGVTIDGRAKCQFLHPDSPCTWEVYCQTGNAISNKLSVSFEASIREIPAQLKSDNLLLIGPIKSYIGQLIPDGYPITIEISQQGNSVQSQRIYTLDGEASLELNSLQLELSNQETTIKILAGGLENSLNLNLNPNE